MLKTVKKKKVNPTENNLKGASKCRRQQLLADRQSAAAEHELSELLKSYL